MIDYMADILASTIERGESIGVDQLIWTVDAKEHAIPTAEELNEAIAQAGTLSIVRESDSVTLVPSDEVSSDNLTDADIALAMAAYKRMVSELTKNKN
jgi:hypothetical protein